MAKGEKEKKKKKKDDLSFDLIRKKHDTYDEYDEYTTYDKNRREEEIKAINDEILEDTLNEFIKAFSEVVVEEDKEEKNYDFINSAFRKTAFINDKRGFKSASDKRKALKMLLANPHFLFSDSSGKYKDHYVNTDHRQHHREYEEKRSILDEGKFFLDKYLKDRKDYNDKKLIKELIILILKDCSSVNKDKKARDVFAWLFEDKHIGIGADNVSRFNEEYAYYIKQKFKREYIFDEEGYRDISCNTKLHREYIKNRIEYTGALDEEMKYCIEELRRRELQYKEDNDKAFERYNDIYLQPDEDEYIDKYKERMTENEDVFSFHVKECIENSRKRVEICKKQVAESLEEYENKYAKEYTKKYNRGFVSYIEEREKKYEQYVVSCEKQLSQHIYDYIEMWNQYVEKYKSGEYLKANESQRLAFRKSIVKLNTDDEMVKLERKRGICEFKIWALNYDECKKSIELLIQQNSKLPSEVAVHLENDALTDTFLKKFIRKYLPGFIIFDCLERVYVPEKKVDNIEKRAESYWLFSRIYEKLNHLEKCYFEYQQQEFCGIDNHFQWEIYNMDNCARKDEITDQVDDIVEAIQMFFETVSGKRLAFGIETLKQRIAWITTKAASENNIIKEAGLKDLDAMLILIMVLFGKREVGHENQVSTEKSEKKNFPTDFKTCAKKQQRYSEIVLLDDLHMQMGFSQEEQVKSWNAYLTWRGNEIYSIEEYELWKEIVGENHEKYPHIGFQLYAIDCIEKCLALEIGRLSYVTKRLSAVNEYYMRFFKDNKEEIYRVAEAFDEIDNMGKSYIDAWTNPKEADIDRINILEEMSQDIANNGIFGKCSKIFSKYAILDFEESNKAVYEFCCRTKKTNKKICMMSYKASRRASDMLYYKALLLETMIQIRYNNKAKEKLFKWFKDTYGVSLKKIMNTHLK